MPASTRAVNTARILMTIHAVECGSPSAARAGLIGRNPPPDLCQPDRRIATVFPRRVLGWRGSPSARHHAAIEMPGRVSEYRQDDHQADEKRQRSQHQATGDYQTP